MVLGVEVSYREQYSFAQVAPANGTDVSANAVFGVEWYDAFEPSARLRLLLRYYEGANPRGQLRDQNLSTFGLTLQADL